MERPAWRRGLSRAVVLLVAAVVLLCIPESHAVSPKVDLYEDVQYAADQGALCWLLVCLQCCVLSQLSHMLDALETVALAAVI